MSVAKEICFHTCTLRSCIEIEMLIRVLEQQTNKFVHDQHCKKDGKGRRIPAESSPVRTNCIRGKTNVHRQTLISVVPYFCPNRRYISK